MTLLEVRSKLAIGVHKLWVFWVESIFTEGTLQEDGSLLIPADVVSRYKKHMKCNFKDLAVDYQQTAIMGAEILARELK